MGGSSGGEGEEEEGWVWVDGIGAEEDEGEDVELLESAIFF